MARHGSIAERLSALRKFATMPDHTPEPLQTDWAGVAANDNNPEDTEDLKHDRKRLVTPSVSEIMRSVATDDIERNEAGQIVRIDRLRFSDGKQTERAYRFTMDGKLEEYAARMPANAMLSARDQVDVALGGEENQQEVTDSNEYFVTLLNTGKARYLTGKRHKGPRIRMTRDEAAAELRSAYANTDVTKVTFTRFPDGLPCGSAKVADSFFSMQKTTCAGDGSMMWHDIVTATADRKEWLDALDELKDEDSTVLDAAKTEKSMSYIGIRLGHAGKQTERQGKRKLIAADDNLMAAIREVSA